MRNEIRRLGLPLPIAIVGMGITGESVLSLLLKAGVSRSDIYTYDQTSPADYSDWKMLLEARPLSLCVSPGISLKTEWIAKAIEDGSRLTSELEIAFSFLTTEKVMAITGSIGKSTTTALLAEGASVMDPSFFVGGNFGVAVADYVTGLLSGKRQRALWLILELSSYQLENFKNLRADIGILTYLSANHLERYSSLEEYYQTKLSLFEKVSSLAIINKNGGDAFSRASYLKTSFPLLDFAFVDQTSPQLQAFLSRRPGLVGTHNLDNLAMAFAAAHRVGWSKVALEKMWDFRGLPHRMENCGTYHGIVFLNDSKSTTMDSVLQAFRSISAESRGLIHLLLGGRDKNLPWEALNVLKQEDRLSISFFGEFGAQAQAKSQLPGKVNATLNKALTDLLPDLKKGDIVLLSPGGTSWDEFKNFEDRGDFFKKWVLAKFKNS